MKNDQLLIQDSVANKEIEESEAERQIVEMQERMRYWSEQPLRLDAPRWLLMGDQPDRFVFVMCPARSYPSLLRLVLNGLPDRVPGMVECVMREVLLPWMIQQTRLARAASDLTPAQDEAVQQRAKEITDKVDTIIADMINPAKQH